MTTSTVVELTGVTKSATSGGPRVWSLSEGGIDGFDVEGSRVSTFAPPGGARAILAVADGLVVATDSGVVVWLDSSTGDELARRPVGGGDVHVVGGADGAFAVDGASGRAFALTAPGTLGPPVAVGGAERVAVARGAIFWTSRDDTVLRGNGLEVEMGALADDRGAIAGCAGSVWVSTATALLRVGAWGGDTSPPLQAPFGPVAHLSCGDGRLVGGSRDGLFVLDPTVDADVRRLDLDFDIVDEPAAIVATKTHAWVFLSTAPRARVVPYR